MKQPRLHRWVSRLGRRSDDERAASAATSMRARHGAGQAHCGAVSSHWTSEGIVSYHRLADGSMQVRLMPYPPVRDTESASPAPNLRLVN